MMTKTVYEDLAGMPDMSGLMNRELGGNEVPARLFAVFMQMWPDLYEGADGGTRCKQAEAVPLLEQLFEMYGVPMKVADNSITVLGHAFDVCAALAMHVMRQLRYPKTFRRINDDWPEEWLSYIEAVAAEDKEGARAWAQKLLPFALDTELPPRCTLDKPGRPNLWNTPAA